jgi:hypothetical protein
MATSIRLTLYRFEQLAGVTPTFARSSVVNETVFTADILSITPVNVAGAIDIPTFPYIYSKLTSRQAGLEQEQYAMQTVAQLQAAIG